MSLANDIQMTILQLALWICWSLLLRIARCFTDRRWKLYVYTLMMARRRSRNVWNCNHL